MGHRLECITDPAFCGTPTSSEQPNDTTSDDVILGEVSTISAISTEGADGKYVKNICKRDQNGQWYISPLNMFYSATRAPTKNGSH